MKYGTPLHAALVSEEYKIAYKILRLQKRIPDFDFKAEFAKVDEDGNTCLHIIMKYFGSNVEMSSKLARSLMKRNIDITARNKHQMTPLHMAFYNGQNEAVKFAIHHNYMLRRSKNEAKYPLFDFNEQCGRINLTPLHYAVYQNNFNLLFILIRSEEQFDHEAEDSLGRKAIDLCKSISSIFKTLRRELGKQRNAQM